MPSVKATHWSDEIDAVLLHFNGAILVEGGSDGDMTLQLRIARTTEAHQELADALREGALAALEGMPSTSPMEIPRELADVLCRGCKQPHRAHVSRGARNLECPNRCPGCDDQGIRYGVNAMREYAWLADGWSEGEGSKYDQDIDFCPFCGFDLRDWKLSTVA